MRSSFAMTLVSATDDVLVIVTIFNLILVTATRDEETTARNLLVLMVLDTTDVENTGASLFVCSLSKTAEEFVMASTTDLTALAAIEAVLEDRME
jgi:hypothetical protein